MVGQARLEPMNASPHHAKVRVSLTLADTLFVAGGAVTGKIEMECKADKGVGIGIIMVELYAFEELTSRDHSATSTFLHTRRLFQGPGLPPSNAVHPYPNAGDDPLPTHYYPARRGITTFVFRLPLPDSSPSAINFGSGLAQVRYEVRATIGVSWKGENRLVFDKRGLDVVESFEENLSRATPEAVVVGENGKIWMQGRALGGFMVAGQPGCLELQVKNHSSKKNSGLSVSLTRALFLPNQPDPHEQPLQISDTLTSVSFKGPEYIIPPGAEGVANLVFDLPSSARGVKGGMRQGNEEGSRGTEPLFEVRCMINVKLAMGLGSKDIVLSIPVAVLHQSAVPSLPESDSYPILPQPTQVYAPLGHDPRATMGLSPPTSPAPLLDRPLSPYAYPYVPSPYMPYVDQGQVWLPPPIPSWPPHDTFYQTPLSPPLPHHNHYDMMSPHSLPVPYAPPARPSSAEPTPSEPIYGLPLGLPPALVQQPLLPLPSQSVAKREEGKGERASRIALHLRMSSRHRSVSPPAHRYAVPAAHELHAPMAPPSSSSIPIPGNISPNYSPSASPRTPHRRPSAMNLSVSPALSQGSVASPRPMLSPKHSFSIDPFTQVTQVEQLERIVAQEETTEDTSAFNDATDVRPTNREKTLPRVPESIEKGAVTPMPTSMDTFFSDNAVHPEDTPPTPTLAAITSLKVPRPAGSDNALSGLDALEAKLLAQVGTRKTEKTERPDVRSVLPIAIPRPIDDPANESAISSLTLPGLDADAKTLKLGQTSHELEHEEQDDDPALTEGRKYRPRDQGSKENRKDGSTGARKSKERERHGGKRSGEHTGANGELHKLRKSAQGRVAAWLGSIEPDVPPPSDTPPPVSPYTVADLTEVAREDSHGRVAAWLGGMRSEASLEPEDHALPSSDALVANVVPQIREDAKSQDAIPEHDDTVQALPLQATEEVTAAPNPRSSGFVPIGTLRADRFTIPPRKTGTTDNTMKPTPSPRQGLKLPRPLDPEVRYDIRSARGGRGGKVAAVAAIWASAAQQNKQLNVKEKPDPPGRRPIATSKHPIPLDKAAVRVDAGHHAQLAPEFDTKVVHMPAKPTRASQPSTPKLSTTTSPGAKPMSSVDFAAKRARMIKSTSVPAAISSSLATPMLSSTASLARGFPPLTDKTKAGIKPAPVIFEDTQPSAKMDVAKSPNTKGDLAFGQARLRELIKRYQGQANA